MVEEVKVKEGYKKTEVGVIPEDWEVVKLKEVVDYTKGYAFKSSDYKKSGIRVIRISDTDYDSINNSDPIYINEIEYRKYENWSLKQNDLILSTVGSKPPMYNSMVGKVIKVDMLNSGSLLNQNAIKLTCKNRSQSTQMLVYNNLKSKNYLSYIEKIFRGNANQASITLKELFEYVIPLPRNLQEQKAIAKALSDIDNLIHSIEKLINKKEKIKQGAMQELLTGKKRLDGFSGEWEIKELGEISDIRTGKKDNEDKAKDGKYPFFVRSQQIEKINSYSYDGEAILIPGEGRIGSIYHYINGKFDYHQRVYKISDFKKIDGKYVYYFMKQTFNNHAMKNSVKATVDSLRLPTFVKFIICYPSSLKEQEAIAQILSDMDKEIDALKEKLSKYKTIKQGMMQELLTGRIRLI